MKLERTQEIESWILENRQNYTIPHLCHVYVSDNFGVTYTHAKKLYYRAVRGPYGGATNAASSEPDDTTTSTCDTTTAQYSKRKVLTAYDQDGKLMNIEQYCNFYGIPFDQAKTYKLVTHTGVPFYNIASNIINEQTDDLIDADELRQLIAEDLKGYKYKAKPKAIYNKKINVVKISDLHFGAYIDNLIKSKDYSISILAERLRDASDIINQDPSEEVHVHILGDLIESFTGLNHKNSWKGLAKGMIGAEAVKLCCQVLHESFLERIVNLKTVKIVAGNHDRLTSDKNEDTEGGAANLIAWGLGLIGYNVEFSPTVITHLVDGICHILTHGHHGISKMSTKDLCWTYGQQGVYNLITEGHLHSIIEKLSIKKIVSTHVIKDDAIDHRRVVAPSFFTGNPYSENLGYTSNSGFITCRNNGKGVPHMMYWAL